MNNEADLSYANGYHPSVLKAHSWRTAENSAPHLLHKLVALVQVNPQLRLLDIGCGSGSITTSLAGYLPPQGHATGVDASEEPLQFAREYARSKGCNNVCFQPGDIYNLTFDDNSFDVVHASQVLMHLPDPVAAVKEMLRVCKPGGLVSLREGLVHTNTIYPDNDWFDTFQTLFSKHLVSGGTDLVAGKKLRAICHDAGLDYRDMESSASANTWSQPDERQFYADATGGRVLESACAAFGDTIGIGPEQRRAIAQGWQDWAKEPNSWFSILVAEMIVTKRSGL